MLNQMFLGLSLELICNSSNRGFSIFRWISDCACLTPFLFDFFPTKGTYIFKSRLSNLAGLMRLTIPHFL